MKSKHILATAGSFLALLAPSARALQIELVEVQELGPTNPVGTDAHGSAVALQGDTLLVGVPEGLTTGSGRVYSYAWSGGSFVLQQKFSFALGGQGSGFGRRIALDADTVVVGSFLSAYVFVRNAGTWALQQWIASPGNDLFYASSVALDGDTALIGQSAQTENQVWVWTRTGTTWALQQKLESPVPLPVTGFGYSTAILADVAAIGAPFDDQGGSNAGAIFVFTRSGSTWTQATKILGTFPFANRRLGISLALHQRPAGTLEIAAGASGPISGEVLILENGGATWIQTARIQPTTGGAGSWFGTQLALDGDQLAVGAWLGDGQATNSGIATVYRRCGFDWIRQADLVGQDSGASDGFGSAVAIEGARAAVGAPSHDGTLTDGGATYVFDLATSPLAAYCFGDGSASACPCGNEAPAGAGEGCANSTGGGAALVLDDAISVSGDALIASACGLIAGESALLFAGTTAVAGGSGAVFGDGLRCAGDGVVRIAVRAADAQGEASFGPGLAALGGFTAGETRYFQVWYRDPIASPCGAGFNLSNGVRVTFEP